MNKRIIGRLLIVSAYLAVGFVAGCVAGANFIARPQQFLREMGDLGLLHEYAQIQYREAEFAKRGQRKRSFCGSWSAPRPTSCFLVRE